MAESAWRGLSLRVFSHRNSLASRNAFPSFLSTQRRFSPLRFSSSRKRLLVTNTLSTNGSNSEGGGGLGSTRLGRLISVRRAELLQRWNQGRRRFPTKIFLLLLGFFCANALATILGQTGDWDVIAAGILVAIIEGIGHFVYNSKLLPAFLGSRGKVVMDLVNFWKIGFTFALFVDAFKVGS